MTKSIEKLMKMKPNALYRKYIWSYSKKEWIGMVIHNFMSMIKIMVAILIVLQLLISASVLADGTSNNYYISENIKIIAQSLPEMEKAFQDLDSLRKSISKVSYQDPDKAYILAFMITKWALANGHDPLEVAAIAKTESNFNVNAVSPKDARGLMQIHRPTWKMDNYFDAEKNLKKATEILYMYKREYPQSYLSHYSGGEKGYTQKVLSNKAKIKKEKQSS